MEDVQKVITKVLINSFLDQEEFFPYFSLSNKSFSTWEEQIGLHNNDSKTVLHLVFHTLFGVLSGVRLSTVASQTGRAWERVKIALTLVPDEKLQDNKGGQC